MVPAAPDLPPPLQVHATFNSPLLAVNHVACSAHPSGPGSEEPVLSPRIVLPRRGLFVYHLGGASHVADPNVAFLLDPWDACRVSHPVPGGDACTVLVPSPWLLEEVFGKEGALVEIRSEARFRTKRIGSSPQVQLALRCLLAAVEGSSSDLLTETCTLAVLEALLRPSGSGLPGPGAARRYAERAREFLATAPEGQHRLEDIATAARCSPFHLARHFRSLTGLSLHQYQTCLRLTLALDRLAEGEQDLARLAVDLGFSHHSHFTARFRAELGVTPRALRSALGRRDLDDMRRILTARLARER